MNSKIHLINDLNQAVRQQLEECGVDTGAANGTWRLIEAYKYWKPPRQLQRQTLLWRIGRWLWRN